MNKGKINKTDPQYKDINPNLNGHILIDVIDNGPGKAKSFVTATETRFNEMKAMSDEALDNLAEQARVPDLKNKVKGLNL